MGIHPESFDSPRPSLVCVSAHRPLPVSGRTRDQGHDGGPSAIIPPQQAASLNPAFAPRGQTRRLPAELPAAALDSTTLLAGPR